MLDKSKDYKVDISECDEEERKAIQEYLFKVGYKWYLGPQDVTDLNRNFLYVYADGDITSSDSRSYFMESAHIAITVSDVLCKETVKDVLQPPITLRDYFAGLALNGMVGGVETTTSAEIFARDAYMYADAMLKEKL